MATDTTNDAPRSRPPSSTSRLPTSRFGPRTRKFIGTIALASLAFFYAIIAVTIATYRLGDASPWVHLVYFTVTGMLWIVPAMWLIKWMIGRREDYDDPGYVDETYWERRRQR